MSAMVRGAWRLAWLVFGGCDLVFPVDEPVSICSGQRQLELCVAFEESQGDVARDGTANHNDATLLAATHILRGNETAIHVDETSIVKVTHTPSLDITGSMTLDLFLATDTGVTSPTTFLGILDNNSQYAIRLSPGVPPAIANVNCVFFDASHALVAVSAALPDTDWHRITCVKDAANIGIYIDTSLKIETPMTAPLSIGGARDLLLGQAFQAGGGIGQHFVGGIDDVRIFARALSPDEIRRP